MLTKIVSGGQTGVDRAALDVAIKLGIPHGGWCPKGRLAELNTTIPEKYKLKETRTSEFSERTKLNIIDSDGSLILVPTMPIKITDGTILTIQNVKQKNKPYLIINLSEKYLHEDFLGWIKKNNIKVLNVAGPRESQSPGIYKRSFQILMDILEPLPKKQDEKLIHTNKY